MAMIKPTLSDLSYMLTLVEGAAEVAGYCIGVTGTVALYGSGVELEMIAGSARPNANVVHLVNSFIVNGCTLLVEPVEGMTYTTYHFKHPRGYQLHLRVFHEKKA